MRQIDVCHRNCIPQSISHGSNIGRMLSPEIIALLIGGPTLFDGGHITMLDEAD